MKINVLSDIHLETYKHNFPSGTVSLKKFETLFPGAFDCDVLVLSGDIVTSPKMLAELVRQSPVPIVYVLGNHEYYGKMWDHTQQLFRNALDGIDTGRFLDCGTETLSGVRFIGATLWTNFHNNDPLVVLHAARGINDFRQIAGCTTDKMLKRFTEERAFLEKALAENDRPKEQTVVVTHFGPSYQSQHSSYPSGGIGYYFVSDLEDLIEKYRPALWIHGHTHDSCDYRIGETRIVSCQPGYEWEARGQKHPPLSIEIPN